MHKTTPYNTGKVLIGSAYQPRPQYELSATEARLQEALLGKRSAEDRAEQLFMRCLYVIGLVTLAIVVITA